MLVSHRWLTELVPGLDRAPGDVADRLTTAGLEVEAVHELGAGLDAVVIAEVKKVEPHPKREKLRLVTVDHGAGTQRVVCGAPNVPEPGGRVLLARVGTHLPAIGVTLSAREIGGVPSEGMLCSETELGLGEDESGIVVLPPGLGALGQPITDAVPAARDTIFEIGVTPNRPDALGHVGVARDVAALFHLAAVVPQSKAPERTAAESIDDLVTVVNEDTDRCPHYGAAAVVDVDIGPSPLWMQWRLNALGIRPISNVVDVTNWLLLEFGQPMHAFDLDLVRRSKIVIRRAKPQEQLRTLDGIDRTLDEDDLVICDGEGPTALAGVMGGETSEIRQTTRRVLLECAYFTPRGVRRTSRRHGLHTESSYRFERGTDWAAPPHVLDRAAGLLCELAGGAVVGGRIHAKGPDRETPRMKLRSSRLDALLGTRVPFDEATSVLDRLGLRVHGVEERSGDRVADVEGASWRPDIGREVDLIEEVARIRGLDELPTILPRIVPQPPRSTGALERTAAQVATELGLSEAVTYSFVSRRELEGVFAPSAVVAVTNPLTEERNVMRTSLLPGLLETLRRARRRGEPNVRLFSAGGVFLPPDARERSEAARSARPAAADDASTLPNERPSFAAILCGARPSHLAKPEATDVYDAKGVAVEMVERLTGRPAEVELARDGDDARHLHPRGAARISVEGTPVGTFGPLHPDVADTMDLDAEAMVVELDLVTIEAIGRRTPTFRAVPRLPAVTRDFAIVVPDGITAGQVQAVIRDAAGELCESVSLFDLFRGEGIDDGHRSLAFHLVYRDPKAASDPDAARTLTDKEVDQRQAEVVRITREKLGATLRG